MPCPLCGDICRCSSDSHSAASPRWLADDVAEDNALLASAPAHDVPEPPGAEVPDLSPSAKASAPDSEDGNQPSPEDSAAWREEVAARLNRYQSRRKPRPPRYPSLQLHFEEDFRTAPDISVEPSTLPDRMPSSNQALALDTFAESASHAVETAASAPLTTAPAAAPVTGKLIEFPRSWTPPPPRFDELAEPVIDRGRPRILEAPEVIPPPPALGGITIETVERTETEKRPGIDIPLAERTLGAADLLGCGRWRHHRRGLYSLRLHLLEGDCDPSAATADCGASRRALRFVLGRLPIFADRVLGHHAGIAPGSPRIGPLRWKPRQPPPPPLARARFLPFGRFSRHGIRLGLPRRRLALLARPDHAYLSRAQGLGDRPSYPRSPMLSSIGLP